MSTFADAIARIRIATWAQADDDVPGLREAALSWGPDAGKVADAAVALDRGDAPAALAALNQAHILQQEARDEASRLRAEALLESGRPQDALLVLQGMAGDDAAVSRARALFRLRRTDEAVPLLDEVLARDPSHWEARLGRAVTYLSVGDVQPAIELLQELREEQPLDPRPYRALIKVFLLTGEPAAGVRLVKLLLDNRLLASPAIAMDLAELYAASDQTDELPVVLDAVTRAAQVGPAQAIELASLWQEVPSSGAIRHLAQAQSHPGTVALLGVLADEIEGNDVLDALLGIDGLEHWLLYERRAAHLLAAERREEALEQLVLAEQLAPRTAAVKLTRAVADLGGSDAQRGIAALRTAAEHPSLRASVRRRAQRALAASGS